MGQIVLTVAAGSVLLLTGPERAEAPPAVAHGLVQFEHNEFWTPGTVGVGTVEAMIDVPPGDYRVLVYAPAAAPRAPARGEPEVLSFTVGDPNAAQRAALIAEITQLEALIARIAEYVSQRRRELEALGPE